MKHYLLAGTALVAAGFTVHAQAAEPISISVNGNYSAGISFTDEDVDDRQAVHVRQDGVIEFNGSTTLDNGLQVGVQVELLAFTSDDQIDEHYVWFEGAFGRLVIGADDHVSEQMHSFVPTVTPGGSDTPTYFLFDDSEGLTPNSAGQLSGDQNKVIYFTPRFSGFQFGASFAPNTDALPATGTGGQYGTLMKSDGDVIESYAVGANFVQEFNAVSLDIGVTYELGSLRDGEDTQAVGTHAYVGFGGFTVGGSARYADFGDASDFYSDTTLLGLGAMYETGPWAFSLGGTYQYIDARNFMGFGGGEVRTWLVDAGASYALGPGVSVWAFAQYWDQQADDAFILENEGIAGMFGTTLEF